MSKAKIDREHYLQIARDEGLAAAITELHHEMAAIESECFEGAKGWQPELYESLKEFRDFSRELWKMNADHAFKVTVDDMKQRRHF